MLVPDSGGVAPGGVIDGGGLYGGGGASVGGTYAAGGDDVFLGSLVLDEDGVDQYQGGAGLDVDSFAFAPGNLDSFSGPGYADGTAAAYGRVFERDIPQTGDWYYVGAAEVIRDVSVAGTPPNAVPIGRALGVGGLDAIDDTAWSFQVTAMTTTSSTSTTLASPLIVHMNTDVALWTVDAPTGGVIPEYATNLDTIPIEWISIPVFSNTVVDGTNVIEFGSPDTNAAAVFFRLLVAP